VRVHQCDMFDKRRLQHRAEDVVFESYEVFLLESSDSLPDANILSILYPCLLVGRILAHNIIRDSASHLNTRGR
jgi:hypothetical protein